MTHLKLTPHERDNLQLYNWMVGNGFHFDGVNWDRARGCAKIRSGKHLVEVEVFESSFPFRRSFTLRKVGSTEEFTPDDLKLAINSPHHG